MKARTEAPRTWPSVSLSRSGANEGVPPEYAQEPRLGGLLKSGRSAARALWDWHDWARGECWLWCGRIDMDVTWIGSIRSSGLDSDLYACRACLHQLDQRVWLAQLRKDTLETPVPAVRRPRQAGAGQHHEGGPAQ
ncbi:hypothetical protein GCM10010400_27170 [Streptomyces aculeolatus]